MADGNVSTSPGDGFSIPQLLDQIDAALRGNHTGVALELVAAAKAKVDDSSSDRERAWNLDRAADIRQFLASIRGHVGNCYCGSDEFQAGRGAIEQMALALEDDKRSMPDARQCLGVLEFLTSIQPMHGRECYGCGGGATQVGLCQVLDVVQERFRETLDDLELFASREKPPIASQSEVQS